MFFAFVGWSAELSRKISFNALGDEGIFLCVVLVVGWEGQFCLGFGNKCENFLVARRTGAQLLSSNAVQQEGFFLDEGQRWKVNL